MISGGWKGTPGKLGDFLQLQVKSSLSPHPHQVLWFSKIRPNAVTLFVLYSSNATPIRPIAAKMPLQQVGIDNLLEVNYQFIVNTWGKTRIQDLVMGGNWSTFTWWHHIVVLKYPPAMQSTCKKEESGTGSSLGCAGQEEDGYPKRENGEVFSIFYSLLSPVIFVLHRGQRE